MWKIAYEKGEIKGHVYDDIMKLFDYCERNNINIYIYSSGSVKAQKLLFKYSIKGNVFLKLKELLFNDLIVFR